MLRSASDLLLSSSSKLKRTKQKTVQLLQSQIIAKHFDRYFEATIPSSQRAVNGVLKLRHEVYCEELGFEPTTLHGLERDEFDPYSDYLVVKHRSTNTEAGCIRVILGSATEELPIERHFGEVITEASLHPQQFAREQVCEFSRLVSRAIFRRRKRDQYQGCAIGALDVQDLEHAEVRCFPMVATSIYLSGVLYCEYRNIDHVFIVTEPRIARSLSLAGINFRKIGKTINYHGRRAPYYVEVPKIRAQLSRSLKPLIYTLEKRLAAGLFTPTPRVMEPLMRQRLLHQEQPIQAS